MPERPTVHRVRRNRPQPDNRPNAAARGYDHRWRDARESFLATHPLCERCTALGRDEAATVVDHRVPHKGDPGSFWDASNWSALCKRCHDVKTATEDGGFGRTVTP